MLLTSESDTLALGDAHTRECLYRTDWLGRTEPPEG